MSEGQNDERVWARPGAEAASSSPLAGTASTLTPAPAVVAPPLPVAPKQKGGDWQTIAALIIFPIPVALWAGFFALIFGVIEFPQVVSKGCTVDCLALQEDVRAAYTDARACDGSGPRLCFVPMGSFSRADIERLTSYYRQRYGMETGVLPGIDLDTSVLDGEAGQAYAPQLLQRIRDRYAALDRDVGVTLIGLTAVDMYVDKDTAGWFDFTMAFYRTDLKVGVISTAEMHPKVLWFKLESTEGDLRLQKQVNQLVGSMHFGLPQSMNPRDAMYWGVTSPWVLDQMPADLPVPRP